MRKKIEPDIVIPRHIPVLMPEITRSDNGIGIFSLNTGTQEVIRISLVYEAGIKYQQKPFTASATLNMLGEGTANYSSKQIAEMLDFYGIYYDVNIDRDYAVVTVCCLKKFLKETLDLLKEIVVYPQFPEDEFFVYKGKQKQQLRIERRKIDFEAREWFAKALFGAEHPYGSSYNEECYDQLTPVDLKNYFETFYTANRCFCVVSGKIDSLEIEQISTVLSLIRDGKRKIPYILPEIRSTQLVYREKDQVLQSAIRIGRVLFDRNHPDFTGMQMLSTVLGGYFGSRLVKNLREDKGYTYGVFSAMINLQHTGYLAIATEVAAEVTEQAIEQIWLEIDRLRTERIGEEELNMVRNVMIGEIMRILDGPFGIADVTIENIQNNKTNASIDQLVSEINTITSDRLLDLASRYFDREHFVTVIAGKK